MRPRITIAGSLGLVLFVALALAGLRSGSVYWVTALAWVLLLWLSASILGVIYRRGRARVFWTGFAVFGWIYLMLIHNSLVSTTLADEMGQGLREAVELTVDFRRAPATPANNATAQRQMMQMTKALEDYKFRVRVTADLCLNLAFAAVGGVVAQAFAARTESGREREAER
jgi:hypothetical protein